MGTRAPDAVKRLVDRFDQDRKVFLSGDYKEEQLPEAKTPNALPDALESDWSDGGKCRPTAQLYELTDKEIGIAQGGSR